MLEKFELAEWAVLACGIAVLGMGVVTMVASRLL